MWSFWVHIAGVGLDDIHEPLPPPQSFAKLLRYRSLRFVHEANEKWGAEHKQIQLAYNHLRRTQKAFNPRA